MPGHPAIFLDRDNTLVTDPGYISEPDQLHLFDDASPAIRRLRQAGYRIVVVTNQSGVARGILTEQQLKQIHEHLKRMLEKQEARIDAVYYCPYLDGPEAVVEEYHRASDLRKPEPGMLLLAAHELNLDLDASWMIGDADRDVQAGRRAGCRTVLVERNGTQASGGGTQPTHRVTSLQEAADIIVGHDNRNAESGEAESSTPPTPTSKQPAERHSPETHEETVRLLSEIRSILDRAYRSRRHQDFSVLRLVGSLLQMLALVAAAWGLAALLADKPTFAIARFALALFLQLCTLTITLTDRRD